MNRLTLIIRISVSVLLVTAVFFALTGTPPKAEPAVAGIRPSSSAWLGTSPYGHSNLHLVAYAGARAVSEALWAAAITITIATPIGLLAALRPGRVLDRIQSSTARLLDTLGIFLIGACLLAVAPKMSTWQLGVVLAFAAWPSIAGVIRTQTISALKAPYVEAAKAIGTSNTQIFLRHVLPQVWGRIQPLCFGLATTFIAVFAALSFFGAGSATTYTLGSLLYDSQEFLASVPAYFISSVGAFVVVLLLMAALTTATSLQSRRPGAKLAASQRKAVFGRDLE